MKKIRIIPLLGDQTIVEYVDAASGQSRQLCLASSFTIEGSFNTRELDTNHYVSVRTGRGERYTYRDPGLALGVDDVVRVPFGSGNTPVVGTVMAVGVKSPPVGYVKDVLAVVDDWITP